MMNPTKAGVMPNETAACWTDSTKTSLTSYQDRRSGKCRQCSSQRRMLAAFLFLLAEDFPVSFQREQKAQAIDDNQQDRETDTQLSREGRHGDGICGGHGRGDQDGDRGDEKQARLKPRVHPVEFLHAVFQPSKQEGGAEHEQRIGDDRTGNRRLDQRVLPGAQGCQRDDQFGQVAKARIEKAASGIAHSACHGFRRMTEQQGKRKDRKDRQYEQQRVGIRCKVIDNEEDWHHGQQPERAVVANFSKQVPHCQVQSGYRWLIHHCFRCRRSCESVAGAARAAPVLPCSYPPSAMVMATRTEPIDTIANAIGQWLPPVNLPSCAPIRNSIRRATPFEERIAV